MATPDKVTTELVTPAHLKFLPLALAFIEESAFVLPFSKEEIGKIRLASEEAVSNTIEHGLENDITETFKIVCIGKPHQFEIHIYEKGKPYDPASIPAYSPENPDADASGLGTFLMKAVMDEVHFNNLGRNGKETALVKYISEGKPDFASMAKADAVPVEDIDYELIDFDENDAQKISECAYSAYGYSYEPYIYYPSKIIQMNKDRYIKSMVAKTSTGEIAGHMAYKFSNNQNSAELGVAFVNPIYRGHNIFKKLSDIMIADAASIAGLKSLYVSCVTGHKGSQTNAFKSGFKTTALMLALLPADIDFKALTGAVKQKESAVVMAMNIHPSAPQTVYTPDMYSEIIGDIFAHAELEIIAGVESVCLPDGETDEIFTSTIVYVLNAGFIFCHAYEQKTVSAIKQKLHEMCVNNISTVFLYLDMTDAATPLIAEQCAELGFIFCGIQPFGQNGNHSLIMQYLNNIQLDFESINLVDPFALKLKSYIEAEYERLSN